MSNDIEAREEARLRRVARAQGLALVKSRCRIPEAVETGTYMLVDVSTKAVVVKALDSGYGLDLDGVEEALRTHYH